MPGRRCAVFGCNNSRVSTKKTNPGIVYHNFPKENNLVSNTIRSEWIRRCKRADTWNPNTSEICSVHFTDNDYERDMRNELLGLPIRKLLKKSAVPTLNLPNMPKNVGVSSSMREERYLKKKQVEQEKLQKEEINKLISEDSTTNISVSSPNMNEALPTRDIEDLEENVHVKDHQLFERYNNLQEEMKIMRRKLNLQSKQLNYYKMKYKSRKASTKVEGINILKKILTDNQIAIILNRKKRVNWTTEEITVAFTLRYLSKKSYVFVRNKLNFPLPGLSTLRKWASRISIKQGILDNILTLLKVAGENMTAKEKTVVIVFDEVKVKSTFEYDVAEDQVLGCHSLMQVCMVRSLFSTWKQPIYLDFDQKMSKDILMDIITKLHEVSYNCVAILSDCGGSNVGLWKDLSVDINKTFFNHPQTKKNIYVFADAPHLLKLLRNWLLDTGFTIDANTKINKKPLQSLIDLTNTEVNSCYKISEKHIIVEKSQRQNVKLAAELLSHNTAQALLRYKPGPDKKLAEDLANFIDDINFWFDIFNSHVKASPDPNPLKSPFGIHLDQQVKHLDKVKEIILSMRAEGKRCLQIFQKRIIMSIESLKSLLSDLKAEFNDVHYVCTHKLNQDCLENFFFFNLDVEDLMNTHHH